MFSQNGYLLLSYYLFIYRTHTHHAIKIKRFDFYSLNLLAFLFFTVDHLIPHESRFFLNFIEVIWMKKKWRFEIIWKIFIAISIKKITFCVIFVKINFLFSSSPPTHTRLRKLSLISSLPDQLRLSLIWCLVSCTVSEQTDGGVARSKRLQVAHLRATRSLHSGFGEKQPATSGRDRLRQAENPQVRRSGQVRSLPAKMKEQDQIHFGSRGELVIEC